jgi:methyl-accepting chemotaxis protein
LAAGVIVLPVAMAMMAARLASPLLHSSSISTAPVALTIRKEPSREVGAKPISLVPLRADVVELRSEKVDTSFAGQLEAEDTQFAMNVFDAGLRRLASADLSTRLETPLPQEFEGMRGDFNRALRLLDDSVAAISRSASRMHGECSAARFHRDQQLLTAVDETPILAAAGDDLRNASSAIRNRATGLQQVSVMAGDAAARLERRGEVAKAATAALTSVAGSNGRISSAVASMRDIAFRANMLSVNASVAAANGSTPDDVLKTFAMELRELAENAATIAKEASVLERDLGISAAEARSSIDQLVREGDSVSAGLETMESRIASISDTFESSTAMMDRTSTVLEELVKAKSERSSSDREWDEMFDRMTHELAMINQHCGRFMKVTVMQDGPPPQDRPPRSRNHLRLIKT